MRMKKSTKTPKQTYLPMKHLILKAVLTCILKLLKNEIEIVCQLEPKVGRSNSHYTSHAFKLAKKGNLTVCPITIVPYMLYMTIYPII